MITWTEFEKRSPALAAAGRQQFYVHGLGLGFLATVRADGGPRVHPVCPFVSPAGLHVLVINGPKLADLRRDGRYALHSETCPPPHEDDGFAASGLAAEVPGGVASAAGAIVREQALAERDGVLWPGFEEEALFELTIERCLLMRTHAADGFPAGPTIWRATDDQKPR
ncbi:MAG TPA: hypothetical protein VG164_04350 [Trebonia sp.]|jgi:hypothetical protein|nr:hypothetical protein [Trebonia sp.]